MKLQLGNRKKLNMIALLALTISLIFSSNVFCNSTIYANPENTSLNEVITNYIDRQLQCRKDNDITLVNANMLGIDVKSKDGKLLSEYIAGKNEYLLKCNNLTETILQDYKIDIEITSFIETDEVILAEVKVNSSEQYNNIPDTCSTLVYHTISLKKKNGNLYIIKDIELSEFRKMYPIGTDFKKLVKELDKRYSDYKNDILNFKDDSVRINATYDTYTDSERSVAAAYARQYTVSGGYSGTSYNNSQFLNYSLDMVDCQNFVSQCLWKGMGGIDTTTVKYPMLANVWWANTTNSAIAWRYIPSFRTWILSATDKSINASEFTVPNTIKAGDFIYTPSHVLFVSSTYDANHDGITQYNEIRISAHTENQKEKNLSELYGSIPPSNMRFMKIYGIFRFY